MCTYFTSGGSRVERNERFKVKKSLPLGPSLPIHLQFPFWEASGSALWESFPWDFQLIWVKSLFKEQRVSSHKRRHTCPILPYPVCFQLASHLQGNSLNTVDPRTGFRGWGTTLGEPVVWGPEVRSMRQGPGMQVLAGPLWKMLAIYPKQRPLGVFLGDCHDLTCNRKDQFPNTAARSGGETPGGKWQMNITKDGVKQERMAPERANLWLWSQYLGNWGKMIARSLKKV